MIEKLKEHDVIDPKTGNVIGTMSCDSREIMDKLNEVIDAVNVIQKEREAERFEIQEWIGILEAVRKSVNIHEKQIDELQMKLEPEKCEIPAGATTTDRVYLEQELDRTRKALDFTVDALKDFSIHPDDSVKKYAKKVLDEITALEQKEVK